MTSATGRRTWQLALVGERLEAVSGPSRPARRPRADDPSLTRLSLGVHLTHIEPLQLDHRCRAMLVALPRDAAFSHWTAAALHRLPTRNCPALHVLLAPRRVQPQRAELVVHARAVAPGDITYVEGIPVTSGARVYVDLAEHLREPELVILGDALLRAGLANEVTLAERVDCAAGRRGVVRARDALRYLDPRAQSAPESLVRYFLASSEMPAPTPQIPIRNAFGLVVAHADLGYEEWRVLVEYEGRQHSEGDQFSRDIERYSRMVADGWAVLRFSSVHLQRPHLIVERVRATLVARGWRPTPRVDGR